MLNYKPHELGVIILAGGHGTRMGGRDKGSVRVRDERLVDVVRRQLPYGAPVCVVSPFPLGLPQVSENPLFGGPAAGIAAGLNNLEARSLAPLRYIAVLSVDAPDSPQMLPKLLEKLAACEAQSSIPSVAAALSGDFIQPLCALWHYNGLRQAVDSFDCLHNKSARRLLHAVPRLIAVPGTGVEEDYDTLAELAEWERRRAMTTARPQSFRAGPFQPRS